MITPVAYIKTLEGKSNAHLIRFSDGLDYVVKFFQTGFEKTLPNEWIGYCLARYLGLPVPYSKLVKIPPEFVAQMPEHTEVQQTEYQFASLYIPDCFNGHEVQESFQITNSQSLAGIILLDYWVCNCDRTRKNILLQTEEPDGFRLWMIDQAEILSGYNWDESDLEVLPVEVLKSATHQLMAQSIESEQSFWEYLELIQTMPIFFIEEIVTMIPDDWMVGKEMKKAIVSTLIARRRKILPELIEKFIKKVYQPLHN
ncbi:HipA family kinase [Neobacillus jeddahensis]|uniref:HipA family kinase n=1 Tax=Neobacillus jeddahensis TaxID=1461580 RepID=UPI00058B6C46|nr:HipA family kinase [Neobacillus jeddahensis]